ncbi:hypothetical protein CE139_04580 [Pseudomonas oryzihabitans]|uniref:Uncharacterized protein n=1 Tax=Pseudomonas oryzihabitans TaxID=47885 RepID=A0A2Z5A3L0_9PSED|nr:hypothetical protein CE139_04580 [Pseudomonas oryzihabitans]
MSSYTEREVSQALLTLHRQLRESSARLSEIECNHPNARAVTDAVDQLNELAASLVVEASLLVPAAGRVGEKITRRRLLD